MRHVSGIPYFSQAKEAGGTELFSSADNPDLIYGCIACIQKSLCPENPDARIRSH